MFVNNTLHMRRLYSGSAIAVEEVMNREQREVLRLAEAAADLDDEGEEVRMRQRALNAKRYV